MTFVCVQSNPFGANFDGSSAKKPKKGEAGYGRAERGSLTALRAQKAQVCQHVPYYMLLIISFVPIGVGRKGG